MEKINKMIEAYNKKAEKWGFDEIKISNGTITTQFKEKSNDNCSFFKKIKIVYQNGYMQEDYEKIKKELNK